jgi:alpha-glucuronidase
VAWYADVRKKLQDHLQLAELWRDTLIAYFLELSGIPQE